ncbi:hypothetical protein GF327_01915 [Candidatus Woesearchaeota archaeon]|nr:hypothetical protein [Candidatus Woesearchaeota archaeon]
MPFIDKVKCLLGRHELEKFMGPSNYGGGKFMQRYKCRKCGKIKKVIS